MLCPYFGLTLSLYCPYVDLFGYLVNGLESTACLLTILQLFPIFVLANYSVLIPAFPILIYVRILEPLMSGISSFLIPCR